MNFRVLEQRGLENARSPFRVVEDNGQEVQWVNRFLDQERVRSVAETTLRSYAYDLLNFLRWWVEVSQTTAINEKAESTLLDYIRFQTNRQPQPAAATINRRVGIAERALRLAFPPTNFLRPWFSVRLLAPAPTRHRTAASGLEPVTREDTQARHPATIRGRSRAVLDQLPNLAGSGHRGSYAVRRSPLVRGTRAQPRRSVALRITVASVRQGRQTPLHATSCGNAPTVGSLPAAGTPTELRRALIRRPQRACTRKATDSRRIAFAVPSSPSYY